jgi:integrase
MGLTQKLDKFKSRILGREISKESTADDYARWIKRFEDWFEGDTPTEATLRDFDSYLVDGEVDGGFPWRMTRPLENDNREAAYAFRTRVKAISALKLWFRLEYGVDIRTQVQNIVLGEPADFEPDHVSEADIEHVVAEAETACDADGCKTAIQLGYDTIMRAAELANVTRDDIDLGNGTIRVRAVKGSLDATLGLDQKTIKLLDSHISKYPDRDKPFHNSYGQPWKPNSWTTHFQRQHHEVGFHAFARHSPIIHRLQYEEFGDVYRRARHAHPQMTARYARVVGVDIPDWSER